MKNLFDSLSAHAGSKWLRADLHLHTPASFDFKWGGLDKAKFSADDYITALQALEIDLIAVTDHSTPEWIDSMIEAGSRLSTIRSITVLPGVELSISGIHFVIVFPEDGNAAKVGDFLTLVGIDRSQRGLPTTVITRKTVYEVVNHAHERGGLVIAAHCMDESHGVVAGDSGQSRIAALQCIDAVEIRPDQDPVALRRRLQELGAPSLPILLSSDAHSPIELKSGVSTLKMSRACFRGLSQIKFEPEMRTSFSGFPAANHPYIVGLYVDGGLFSNVPVRFSPHLNSIIGGRGSGKSALLDLLRFGLGIDARIEGNRSDLNDRIKSFVGNGATVSIFFKSADAYFYCVKRRGDYTEGRRGVVTFNHPPELFKLIDQRFIAVDGSPSAVLPIEFFGQGEVMELTKKGDQQLQLIDEHINFGTLKDEEKALTAELITSIPMIIEEETLLEQLAIEVNNKESLTNRIEYLEKELLNPIFDERAKWENERSYIEWTRSEFGSLASDVARELSPSTPAPTLNEDSPNLPSLSEHRDGLENTRTGLEALRQNAIRLVSDSRMKSEQKEGTWNLLDEANRVEFQAAIAGLGGSGIEALHNELATKRELLRKLTQVSEPAHAEKVERCRKLREEREAKIGRLLRLRSCIHLMRTRTLKQIHRKLKSVHIRIDENADRNAYYRRLKELVAGSHIQNQDEQIQRVTDAMLPSELAQSILRREPETLVTRARVTSNTASKISENLSVENALELQVLSVHDLPTILMKRAGEAELTPLDKLSVGEKCSALLSIALLEKNRPLLMDQPEDELDNLYVIDDIVSNINLIKPDRQLIIATHDPNIPVLGDAELILRARKEIGVPHCTIHTQGGLEDDLVVIEVLSLEGGSAAFEKRRLKYRIS